MEIKALSEDSTQTPLGRVKSLRPDQNPPQIAPLVTTDELIAIDGPSAESRTQFPEQDKWSEFKRNLSAFFFNMASVRMDNLNNQNSGNIDTYNYLSINYRLSREERISFRPVFTYNSAGPGFGGRDEESDAAWGDAYVQYTNFGWKLLPFNMTYITHFRAYLPTSENSQNRGLITQLRPYVIMIAPITSRLLFAIHMQGDYFIQRRTGYLNERGFPRGNANYGYNVFGEVVMRVNPVFGFGGSVGHKQRWNYAVPVENLAEFRFEDFTTSAFVNINYGGFLTAIGVNQARGLTRQTNQFSLFRDDETQYFARSVIRF